VLAAQQLKPCFLDNQMQKSLFRADRATAIQSLGEIGLDAKSDAPAVATAFVIDHHGALPLCTPFSSKR
jgi:hypothetical protein